MTAFAWRSLVLASLAAGAGVLCRLSPEVRGGDSAGVIMKLPAALPDFVSEARDPDPLERKLLPADTQFAKAVYYSPVQDAASRDVIHCEIVLSGAERRSIHRPEVCLQGQGWTLMESSTRRLPMGGGRELSVRDLYIRKDITLKDGTRRPLRAHFFYWFVGQDVTTPSHAGRIWLTLRDNVAHGVNHRWAYATRAGPGHGQLFAAGNRRTSARQRGHRVASWEIHPGSCASFPEKFDGQPAGDGCKLT